MLAQRKYPKKCARGNLFRCGSLWTPSPTTKGAPPLMESPAGDLRGTLDGRTEDDGCDACGRDGGSLIRRFAPAVSLRLGHAAALTCPRQVIHYRGAASLPRGSSGTYRWSLSRLIVTFLSSLVPPRVRPSPGGRWQTPSPARRLTDEGLSGFLPLRRDEGREFPHQSPSVTASPQGKPGQFHSSTVLSFQRPSVQRPP